MAHYPEESIESLSSRRVLDFLVHLQNDRKLAGSAAKKTRLRVRLLLGGTLGEPAPKLPEPPQHCCPKCQGALEFLREIARINPYRGPPL